MNQNSRLRRRLQYTAVGTVGMTLSLLPWMSRPAQAQPVNCPGSSNVEINYCLRLDYEAADRDLNAIYKRVIKQLDPAQKAILTDAQIAWITYRDNNCEAEEFRSRGGTGHSGFLSECLTRMTRARTAELRQFDRDLNR